MLNPLYTSVVNKAILSTEPYWWRGGGDPANYTEKCAIDHIIETTRTRSWPTNDNGRKIARSSIDCHTAKPNKPFASTSGKSRDVRICIVQSVGCRNARLVLFIRFSIRINIDSAKLVLVEINMRFSIPVEIETIVYHSGSSKRANRCRLKNFTE